ncbi:hypothetical protein [Paenibacillus hamazuiensis]|nr:hypothetical protein [Paenibacillus hamazuiensis]
MEKENRKDSELNETALEESSLSVPEGVKPYVDIIGEERLDPEDYVSR